MTPQLTERHYELIDALSEIAGQLDTTVARVALAWVQARAGVSSTIIGARTPEQLEDNLQALGVRVTGEQTDRLDELTAPQLPFPFEFLRRAPSLQAGGTTINGETSVVSPFAPASRDDHY